MNMIECIEARRLLSATAVLVGTDLRVNVTSAVDTTINVNYANGRIDVYVKDEAALRRVYIGDRKAISTIHVVGSAMSDRVNLGEGIRTTTVDAGAGRDVIVGNSAANIINGGDGADQVYAGDGDDSISGGNGNDTLYGGAGNDSISGDADADSIRGEAGNDRLYGGAGVDFIHAGSGTDAVSGGAGRDQIIYGVLDTIDAADAHDDLVSKTTVDSPVPLDPIGPLTPIGRG